MRSITLALKNDDTTFALWTYHFQMLVKASVNDGCRWAGKSAPAAP